MSKRRRWLILLAVVGLCLGALILAWWIGHRAAPGQPVLIKRCHDLIGQRVIELPKLPSAPLLQSCDWVQHNALRRLHDITNGPDTSNLRRVGSCCIDLNGGKGNRGCIYGCRNAGNRRIRSRRARS